MQSVWGAFEWKYIFSAKQSKNSLNTREEGVGEERLINVDLYKMQEIANKHYRAFFFFFL